jgi:hypothetical protein
MIPFKTVAFKPSSFFFKPCMLSNGTALAKSAVLRVVLASQTTGMRAVDLARASVSILTGSRDAVLPVLWRAAAA